MPHDTAQAYGTRPSHAPGQQGVVHWGANLHFEVARNTHGSSGGAPSACWAARSSWAATSSWAASSSRSFNSLESLFLRFTSPSRSYIRLRSPGDTFAGGGRQKRSSSAHSQPFLRFRAGAAQHLPLQHPKAEHCIAPAPTLLTPTDATDFCLVSQSVHLFDKQVTPVGPALQQLGQVLNVLLVFFRGMGGTWQPHDLHNNAHKPHFQLERLCMRPTCLPMQPLRRYRTSKKNYRASAWHCQIGCIHTDVKGTAGTSKLKHGPEIQLHACTSRVAPSASLAASPFL